MFFFFLPWECSSGASCMWWSLFSSKQDTWDWNGLTWNPLSTTSSSLGPRRSGYQFVILQCIWSTLVLEELRQMLSSSEQQAVFREDKFRRDIEDLQKRYQAHSLSSLSLCHVHEPCMHCYPLDPIHGHFYSSPPYLYYFIPVPSSISPAALIPISYLS